MNMHMPMPVREEGFQDEPTEVSCGTERKVFPKVVLSDITNTSNIWELEKIKTTLQDGIASIDSQIDRAEEQPTVDEDWMKRALFARDGMVRLLRTLKTKKALLLHEQKVRGSKAWTSNFIAFIKRNYSDIWEEASKEVDDFLS